MYYINLVMKITNCDEALAREVLNNMGEYRLSAMTEKQLIKVIKEVFEVVAF